MATPKPWSVWVYDIVGTPNGAKGAPVVAPAYLASEHATENAARRRATDSARRSLFGGASNIVEIRLDGNEPGARFIKGLRVTEGRSTISARVTGLEPFTGPMVVEPPRA